MITLSKMTIETILQCKIDSDDFNIEGVAIDSREVSAGNLFATWQGENFDGIQFCNDAVLNGASALLINKPVDCDVPQIIVPNVIEALAKLASYWREQFELPVIGVTGSNGKTTVKNMLRSILQQHYGEQVVAPIRSFNNHIGVPLTLSQLNSLTPVAVIEMGMNHFGEIAHLADLAKPTIGVITNAGLTHLEGLGSVAGIAKAKGELLQALPKAGIAVLNADDGYFNFWQGLLTGQRIISFGLSANAEISAANIGLSNQGCYFRLLTPQGECEIQLGLLGQHNVLNALAAAGVANALKIPLQAVQAGLAKVKPESRRLECKPGQAGALIIDDSYNASPSSMRKAIDVLARFPGQRILVMGDMLELGPTARELHAEIGHYAQQAGIEYLFTSGDLSQAATKAFGQKGQHCPDKPTLVAAIKPLLNEKTVVAVKASNGMNYNRVVAQLAG